MKKPTILRMLIFVLAMLFNFASYAQNGITYNSKFPKSLNENIFLKANNQFEDPANLNVGTSKTNVSLKIDRTTNPVIKFAEGDFAGVVSECPNDGKKLPKLFLCGSNDSRLIETGITDATSIVWQRRTGGCPATTNSNCANEAFSCTWTDVGTGPDYNANTAGEFRVRIRYFDESVYTYYFNVYKNDLDPTGIIKSDIVKSSTCTLPGSIRAGGFGANYEYSFTTASTADVWQGSDTYPVTVAGTYNVFIRLKGLSGSCIFNVKNIVVKSLTFASTLTPTQLKCSDDKGSITITTNDTNRQYNYVVTKDGAAFGTYGPYSVSEYPLNGLLPGVYKVVTSIEGSPCISDTKSITINTKAPLGATLGVTVGTICQAGNILVTPSGGTSPYKYFYSVNGGAYVANGTNATIAVSNDGTYDIRVEDANSCSVVKSTSIASTSKPEYEIKLAHQDCNGGKPSINIKVNNARVYSLEYSINNGSSFQTSTSFSNLQPGDYSVVVRYGTKKNNGNWNSYCEDKAGTVTLLGGNTQLTASGGVAELVGCSTDPANINKGKVRITNPQGGVPPFKYSFDSKGSWIDKNEAYVLPSDTPYTLYIKDALGCEYEMKNIKLDFRPADPSIEYSDVVYNCDGTGQMTAKVTNSGGPGYAYQYTIDGKINTNVPPNVFNNIPVGPHTIRVDYKLLSVPTYSNLLVEDFGNGDATQSPGITKYCFNDQRVNGPYPCGTRSIEDNAYAVTYFHWRSDDPNGNNSGAWFHFKDHTTNPNNLPNTGQEKGRFLLVNVGSAAGPDGILYSKLIKDVIPNQPVELNVAVANLLKAGQDGFAPKILFQLVDKNGNVVASHNTGEIAPGKNHPDRNKWVTPPTITLDPGDNDELTFVVRSGSVEYGGNDLLIDDISVRQLPKSCVGGGEFKFEVLPLKAFTAKIANATPVKCNGSNDGSFQIVAENFNTTDGFEYSLDGINWYISKVGTVDFPNVNFPSIVAKTYDIKVRNKGANSCDKSISAIINAPAKLELNAQSFPGSCGKGRVEVTIKGGSAPYKNVILTKKSDGSTTAFIYDVPSGKYILKEVLADTYTISADDNKDCPTTLGTDLIVTGPARPRAEIDVNSNFCFKNNVGASIKVNIIGGQGPYSYKVSRDGGINYGPYSATFSETSFTYPALTTGTYHFIIMDANSCDAIAASQTIDPQFEATPTIKAALSCKPGAAAAATIEVEIVGGTSPYKYLIKDSLGNTKFTSGSITNPIFQYETTIADTYTFEITDANNCTISIEKKVNSLVSVTAKETTKDVTCVNADNGTVDLEGVTGLAPFKFQFNGKGLFEDETHYEGLKGSAAGITYTYIVKDANECVRSYSFKIYQKDDLAGTATILPVYNCDNPATITVSGVLGGTAPYQYTLLKDGLVVVEAQDGLVFRGINVTGIYSVTITDANSCTKTVSAGTISALNPPADMKITDSGAKCPDNKADVTITNVVNAAGVAITGTLEYRIVLPVAGEFQPGNVFTGLDATVAYTFEVRDVNKCTYQGKHTILVPKSFAVGSKSTPVKCFEANDGTATFTVTGIAAGTKYTYKIDSDAVVSATSAGSSFDISKTGLTAGDHSIIVTNLTTNCFILETVKVEGPTAKLALNLPDLTHVTCKNQGTATINAVDGWSTYTYTVTRTAPLPAGTPFVQENNNVFTNLIAGTYSVSVSDSKGCTVAGQTFTINDAVKPSATIDVTTSYCAGGVGATLVATPTAEPKPNPDYEYSLNDGDYQDSGTFSGLVPADYTITVRDKVTGCINTVNAVPITIAQPLSATPRIEAALTCDPTSPEAKIEVSIQNGYPDYKYRVSTTAGSFSGGFSNVGIGLTKFTVSKNAGTYYFEITDSKGCIVEVSQKVESTVKPDFTTDLVDVKCKGDNTGSITVYTTPTLGAYTYVLNTLPATVEVTQSTNIFKDLKAGKYSIYVIDAKKCKSDAKTIDIGEPLIGLTVDAKVTTELLCDASNNAKPAKITVTVTGGTPYPGLNPYRYSYNGVMPPVTSNVYTTTDSGTVTVQVFDESKCSLTAPIDVDIKALKSPTALAFSQNRIISCKTTEKTTDLKVTVTDGVAPFKFEITSTDAAIAPETPVETGVTTQDHTFLGLYPGNYYFKITDINGCTVTDEYYVIPVEPIQAVGAIVSNVTCNGLSNGVIKFTISGYTTGGYTFGLVSSASPTNIVGNDVAGVVTYTGLKGDLTYTFTVTNTATGCTATDNVILGDPDAITIVKAEATKVFCTKPKTNITIAVTGGTGTLNYAVVKQGTTPLAGDYNTTGLFEKDTRPAPVGEGLLYDVYITDGKSCPEQTTLTIEENESPVVNAPASQCFTGAAFDITITGTVYTGSTTKLYGINNVYDTNPIKNITKEGTYKLSIKDDNGCVSSIIDYIVTKQLTANPILDKDLTCTAVLPFTTDAQVTITPNGGTGTYTYKYKVDTGSGYGSYIDFPDPVFKTPTAGKYIFEVTSGGCKVETSVIEITTPIQPVINDFTASAINCFGEENASITIDYDNAKGEKPYVFNVFNNTSGVDYKSQTSGLAAGNYTVTITDAKGCSAFVTKNIDAPKPIVIKHHEVPITCIDDGTGTGVNMSKGSIIIDKITDGISTVGGTGGTKPYNYYVTGVNGYNEKEENNDGTTSFKFNVVDFGLYQIRVVDAKGCTQLVQNVLVASDVKDLDIIINSAVDCASPTKGIADITIPDPAGLIGPGPFYFALYTGPGMVYDATSPLWFPEDGAVGSKHAIISGLIPGVLYTFIVFDSKTGCYYYETSDAPVPTNSKIVIDKDVAHNITCKGNHDGTFSFELSTPYGVATPVTYQLLDSQSLAPIGAAVAVTIPATGTLPVGPITGLYFGYYFVLVKEVGVATNAGCSVVSDRFNITESQIALGLDASSTHHANTCVANAGIITAIANNGTASVTNPYLYQIFEDDGDVGVIDGTDPVLTDPVFSATFSNALHKPSTFYKEKGDYIVYVRDANGCIKAAFVTVLEDEAPKVTPPAAICFSDLPKTVTISGTVFTGSSISYSIGNGLPATAVAGAYRTTPSFLITAPGNYTFFIKDDNNCVAKIGYVVSDKITVDLNVKTPLSCKAVKDATIHGEVAGGLGTGYSYRVKFGTGGTYSSSVAITTTTFDYTSATLAGDYIFEITDGNCKIENTVTVNPLVPTVFDVDIIDVKCKSESTGIIIVNVTSADFAVEYKLDKTDAPTASYPYQATNRFDNLPAGTYTITVKNSQLCEAEITGKIVGEPLDPLLAKADITQFACGTGNAAQPAKVELSAIGGTGLFEYSFDGSDFSSSKTVYTVNEADADRTIPYVVRDANGCTDATGSVFIPKLVKPSTFDITPSGPITCDVSKIIIKIENVTGRTGATYSYATIAPSPIIIAGSATGSFPDLTPGTYMFRVTDIATGCIKDIRYIIDDVIKINIEEKSLTDITCFGADNGKASFLVTGFGTATYTYKLDTDPAVTGPTDGKIELTNLTPGDHRITVLDNATNCSMFFDFNIATPTELLEIYKVVTPLGCTTDGKVVITADKGWGSYLFTLTDPDGIILPTKTEGTFGGLKKVGTYTFSVEDAKGCIKSDTFQLFTPEELIASIAASSVYCYSGAGAGATLVVNATTTNPPKYTPIYQYSIDNGESWHGNTFTDVAPGDYQITVIDQFGCQAAVSVPVKINGQLFASARKDKEIFCAPLAAVDGKIIVKAVGGYPPYSYTVTKNGLPDLTLFTFPTATATEAEYTVTGPGKYEFTITDSESCETRTNVIEMLDPTPVKFTPTPTSPSCTNSQGEMGDGQILVEVEEGNGPYKYTIQRTSLPAGANLITQDGNGLFTGLIAGTYTVNVISARGCEAPSPVIIAVPVPVVANFEKTEFECTPANVIKETVVTIKGSGGAGTAGVIDDYRYSDNGTDWYEINKFNVSAPETAQSLIFYVKDLKGCMASVLVNIDPFPTLESATPKLIIAADCPNSGQETIGVDIVGGALPYEFKYQAYQDGVAIGNEVIIPAGDNTFEYVAPDAGHLYHFLITDLTTKCTIISGSHFVKLYKLMKVTANPSSMVSCDGFSDGTITINIENYTKTYDYKVLLGGVAVVGPGMTGTVDVAANNPFTITGLAAGTDYTVEVLQKAYPQCPVISNSVTITQPPVLNISDMIVKVVNQNCNNLGATITIDPTGITGGTKGYEFSIEPLGSAPVYKTNLSRTVKTTQVGPLNSDTWTIFVKDAKGCTLSQDVKVSLDPMPTIKSVKVLNQCATTGYRIDVVAEGLAKLQYSLDGVQYQDESFLMVNTPGDYTVWVWDKNQCAVKAAALVTVLKPLTLEAELTTVPVCKNPNGTITLTAGGGTVTPANSYVYTKNNWANQQVDNVFRDLAPGSYTFTVRDNVTLCEKEIKVNITIPIEIDGMVATPRKTSCKGSADGGISVTLSDKNVNPKYTYSITGIGVNIVDQDSPNFNGLSAGIYSVTVKSGLGCEKTLLNIEVEEPKEIFVTASFTEFGCATGNITDDAIITVDNVKGGSGDYLVYEFKKGTKVLQSGLDNSYTVEGDHSGGTYTVTVYDSNNCQGTNTTPITIRPFATIDAIAFDVKVPITCLVSETLQVIASTTGTLTAPLKYTLKGSGTTVIATQINNDGLFQGLGIGSYEITVLNEATGCSLTVFHYVYDPNTFSIAVNPIQSEVCYGASDGKVELTFVDNQPTLSDDAGPFDYKITGPLPDITGSNTTGVGPVTISGLISGLYTVTATLRQSPGCTVTNTFQITQPAAELEIKVTSTPITCKEGSDDGTITATAVGGWPGEYQYELVGSKSVTYSDVSYFENLTAGKYTVSVKDSKGCIDSFIVDLDIPKPITFTAAPSATVLSCFGDTNATITVTNVKGGQESNYSFTINHTIATGEVITSGPQESNIFTGLGAGNYTIVVSDGFSCEATSVNITINDPLQIEPALALKSSATCLASAELTIGVTGGTGPYTYSEDGIIYGTSFNSSISFPVGVGTHHYFVKDNVGCVRVSNDYTVDPIVPLAVELDLRNATVNCTGESTAIIVSKATGGLGNYQYSLVNGTGVEIRAAQAEGIFDDLNVAAGPYTVHVKSGDCEINSTATIVTEPQTALTSSYVVEPVKCFGDNNGKIIVTASGGTGVIKYAISPYLNQFDESGAFDRLEAGTYTVIVQDILGCNAVYVIDVKEPAPLIASEIPNSVLPEICKEDKDAQFGVQIKGGTAPYFESLDNEKGPYLPVNGLTKDYIKQVGGNHTVYIKDSNGCISKVEIRMPEPVILDPTYDINYDCVNNAQTNMVTVTVDKSNTDLSEIYYSLDSDVGPGQPSNIFTNVAPGRHYIVAIHSNGCKVPTSSFDIKAYDPLTLAVSGGKPEMNIISVTAGGGAPAYEYSFNGEPFTSSNRYKIYKSGDYVVVVRDKNGCTATITVPAVYIDVCLDNYFTPAGVTNTTWGPGCTNIYNNLEFSIFDRYGRVIVKYHYGQKWDGRYNGADLPSGDYWYVLKLNDPKDDREFVGHFTLYR